MPMRMLDQPQLQALPALACNTSAVRYARDCIGLHSRGAVRNVDTQLQVLDTGRHVFPVSVNDGTEFEHNSYVVSPRNTYSGYARHEIGRLPQRWLRGPLDQLARGIGTQFAAAGVDRLVQVNNWLLSTNLYPIEWDGADLAQLTQLLVARHPGHAVCWRSLNSFSNRVVIDRLLALGYLAIPSRQVWLFDGRAGWASGYLRHHNNRLDATLLRRTAYDVVPGSHLAEGEYDRLEALYRLLYIDKYCPLNPQFTAGWMRCGQRDGWLQLQALRSPEGRLDGVVGWVADAQVMTAPIVGYDTALPQRLGLYRLLTQMCLQEAARRRTLLNFSSGAAHFKRLRGGRPQIEYSLVHVRHLPARQRRTWALLGQVLRSVGVPVMTRYQL